MKLFRSSSLTFKQHQTFTSLVVTFHLHWIETNKNLRETVTIHTLSDTLFKSKFKQDVIVMTCFDACLHYLFCLVFADWNILLRSMSLYDGSQPEHKILRIVLRWKTVSSSCGCLHNFCVWCDLQCKWDLNVIRKKSILLRI